MQSLAPMYGTEDGDPGLNAFKQAEKLYQLHREQLFATLK